MLMHAQARTATCYEDLCRYSRAFSKTQPAIAWAAAMVVFMFSAGGHPAAGLASTASSCVFQATVEARIVSHFGALSPSLASVIGAFYYLRIIKVMYFDEPVDSFDGPIGGEMKAVIAVSSLIIILFFLYPAPVLTNAAAAAAALFR